jgi:hypothetical protein
MFAQSTAAVCDSVEAPESGACCTLYRRQHLHFESITGPQLECHRNRKGRKGRLHAKADDRLIVVDQERKLD